MGQQIASFLFTGWLAPFFSFWELLLICEHSIELWNKGPNCLHLKVLNHFNQEQEELAQVHVDLREFLL